MSENEFTVTFVAVDCGTHLGCIDCCFDHRDSCTKPEILPSCDGIIFKIKETVEYPNACEVDTDENSFVRDGVRYVAEERHDNNCIKCDGYDERRKEKFTDVSCAKFFGVSCLGKDRKDGKPIRWKRADTQTRQMTAKEIYELAHQGAAFAEFNANSFEKFCSQSFAANNIAESFRYCLPCDMTDDEPKTWNWRKLEKVG